MYHGKFIRNSDLSCLLTKTMKMYMNTMMDCTLRNTLIKFVEALLCLLDLITQGLSREKGAHVRGFVLTLNSSWYLHI